MIQNTLCSAIASHNLVRFYYASEKSPGIRIVEPYMIAYNQRNNLILSAWFLEGASASKSGAERPPWREYMLDKISSLSILEQTFAPPRPGYVPDGGKIFRNVQCAV